VFSIEQIPNSWPLQYGVEGGGGVGGGTPAGGGVGGGGGGAPPALGDFCTFVIKITYFYAYFGQNKYFKATTHLLKAFKISPNAD